jgi:hypothetical protein
MNARRSFLIALPLGLLLTAAAYVGLFFLQLGVPTTQWGWVHEIIDLKLKIARAVTRPKLLIVGGSSALYGISAEEIERQTGFATANFGTVMWIGPAITLHLTRKACRPGDTVLLAFEYEAYLFGKLTGDTTDELLIAYLIGHDREYVRSMSLHEQLKLALLTPGDRLWSGVRAVFQKPKDDEGTAAVVRSALAGINGHGDRTNALPERRPEHSAARSTLINIPAYGFPPSPPGFVPIQEFCAWAKANSIRVLATFPNTCHRPEYDLPAAQQMPAQFRAFYSSMEVPVLGKLSEAMLPEDQMFDSAYHPMQDAAIERTRRLLVHLAPFLKLRPAR